MAETGKDKNSGRAASIRRNYNIALYDVEELLINSFSMIFQRGV
jgi:hypothetical protein